MKAEQLEKIVLKYTKKYYPRDAEDWEARGVALAMCGEIIREINLKLKKWIKKD